MSDRLAHLLRQEADRLAGSDPVPPISGVYERADQLGSRVRRRLDPTRARVLAPVLAGLLVVATVVGVQQLRPDPRPVPPAIIVPPPVAAAQEGPELGTVELPTEVRASLAMSLRMERRNSEFRDGRPPDPTVTELPNVVPPTRADVLARTVLSDTVTLWTYGIRTTDEFCIYDYVQVTAGGPPSRSVSGGCGPVLSGAYIPAVESRSFSFDSRRPESQRLSGVAPPGTQTVRLSAQGQPTKEVRAYDGGPRWRDRSWFTTSWPYRATTTVTAIRADGTVLATSKAEGVNPRAFEDDYLAALATCLEQAGVEVERRPQGQGAGPAYSYDVNSLPRGGGKALEDRCEAEAEATPPR